MGCRSNCSALLPPGLARRRFWGGEPRRRRWPDWPLPGTAREATSEWVRSSMAYGDVLLRPSYQYEAPDEDGEALELL